MAASAQLGVASWHRLNRLLAQALELEPDARASWLRNLPPSESDLLPLLRQLLASHHRAGTGDFASALPRFERPPLVRPTPGGASQQAGQLIGPYRLLRELGQGGMGTVWLAQRADGVFDRQVALKLPRAEWTDAGLARRLARERAVLASMNHPNIAQLLDAGWSESGRPYLALEYIEGRPLPQWCDEHRLDTQARLRLFVDVVRAAAHAHARLVVHRDLKPSNVLVTAEGRVKLLDFGIAKLLVSEAVAAEETDLTRASGRALTLNYAAPEQVLGAPISTAVDIYALGVVLFELLSGERPYRLQRASRAALEEAIVNVEIPAPSSVAKDKSAVRALRGDLDRIVLKALKKRPEQRYETAAAFADDIQRFLGRRPVLAQRDSAWYRVRRFVVRNRVALGGAGAVATSMGIGLSLALWQAREAREQAERATRINEFVLSIIQEADPAASRRTREADIAQLVATEHRVENEFKHRPELALPLRLAIGVAYRNRGDFVRARQILRTAIDEAAGVVPAGNEDLLKATIQYAATLAELGEPLSEGAGLDKVIEALRQLGGRAAPALVDALIARSAHRVIAFEEDAAFDDAKEAHETARHALSADDERRLSAAEAFARRLLIGFQTQRALEVLETAQATAAKQPRLASSHPAVIQAKSSYGIALCMSGRSQEGIEVLKDSLGAARASHGGASHVAVRSLESLAEGFRCGGHLKQALATYREMWAIVDANAGLAHIRHLRRTGWMHALLESRRPEEARPDFEEFERSIVSMPASKAREHHRSMLETTRAILLLGLGDTRQAETLLRERLVALAPKSAMLPRLALGFTLMQNGKLTESREVLAGLRGAIAGRPSPDLWMPQALANSALLELELNQPEQALEFAREALAICARQNRPSVPFVADLHIARGRALLMLGRATEARDSLRKADEFWRDFDPDSPWSAEAAYWHGQSLVATGEIARGKNMIGEMRPRLAASPLPLHRALASPFPPAKRAG